METQAVLQRFLKYVTFETTSDSKSATFPSTPGQRTFAEYLTEEMKAMGIQDAHMDENCYVYGTIPANNGKQGPVLALVSHMDTAPAASGRNVRPRLVENYDGGDIVLNEEKNIRMETARYPELSWYKGQTLIVTDGTTLLGADDKAGIAEILTMAERLVRNPEIKHGTVEIVFMPDEEIGRSTKKFDAGVLKADYGYTVDGGYLGKIQYENFNGASAVVTVKGVKAHTGSAKGKMINSQKVAMEFHGMLPAFQAPEYTTGYEGFFYLDSMQGTLGETTMKYLIREHDGARFEKMKEQMRMIASHINRMYGKELVTVDITDSYYNMREKVEPHLHLIESAKQAMRDVGVEPQVMPIRGCTDGVLLAFMGLPCPNLPTGGHNAHSEFEFISVQSLEKMVDALISIVGQYAGREKADEKT